MGGFFFEFEAIRTDLTEMLRAGLPDIMCYAMAKEAREKYDEQLKEFHGYVSMYQEREGTVGASGGTLSRGRNCDLVRKVFAGVC